MTPRTLAIAGAALVVVSFVLAALADGAGDVIAVAVGGIGGVALVSAVFYAIGLAEDRDRDRERERRDGPGDS